MEIKKNSHRARKKKKTVMLNVPSGRPKVKLMRSLVIFIFLYARESWTLTAELEKRTQAFEMRCYQRLLNISYKDQTSQKDPSSHWRIWWAADPGQETVTEVVWPCIGLAKTTLQGTVKGKRRRGRQKKRWEDNIKGWTRMGFVGSTRAAESKARWKGIVANQLWCPTTSQGYGME